jgi:pyrimidine-nucleoside phosphorylase
MRTDLTTDGLLRQVDEIGCAVAAQTEDLVPADGALYALRDATATVPSIPLIAASVMSKKLAVGTDLILLDVKAGSGAFMKNPADADRLATACMELARGWGRRARAAVTDMSQPLGEAIGNALDVAEAVRVLRGEERGRLGELAVAFAGTAQEALLGLGSEESRAAATEALSSGRAGEAFARMVEAQGGDPRVVDEPEAVLPRAPVVMAIEADRDGVLGAMDAESLGWAAARLGAGRARKGDPIDPAVGIVFRPKIGERMEAGEPLGEVHARDEEAAARAIREVLETLELTDQAVEPRPLVYGWRDA